MSARYPLTALRWHATRNDPLGLTPGERKAAELLCTCSVTGTAAALGIKPATVVGHRREAYRKLRISTRAELRARMATTELSEPFAAEVAE
jgi:DNA-binding CsgD family transcriptional regulator